MTDKKIVALYARVSTDKQTVDMQTSELEEFIKRRGWKLFDTYIDQGFSGKNTNRPAFNAMMTQARERRFDILLVWKLDRLSRSLKDLINTLDDLSSFGIDFISFKDRQIDTTTASGRLLFSVMASMAEFERTLTSERIKAGLANAKRKGKTLGAKRKLTPALFQKGLEMKNNGLSNRQIAKELSISEGTFRYWLRKK